LSGVGARHVVAQDILYQLPWVRLAAVQFLELHQPLFFTNSTTSYQLHHSFTMASGGQAGVGKELESDIRDMDIKDEIRVARPLQDIPAAQPQHDISGSGRDGRPTPLRKISRVSESPRVSSPRVQSPAIKPEKEAVVGGDIILKMEPGEAPKLSRKASHKVPARPPPLFSHLPDSTLDAKSKFEVMDHCSYAAKWMGYSEPPLECDCSEEWGNYHITLCTFLYSY